jgi:hypothetical protein
MIIRALAAVTAASVLAAIALPVVVADPPPSQADCVAQFVTDFQNLFPGFTIGDVQGHLGLPIPGYVFPIGGQAHYLQPFGELLRGQATAAPTACPFDLTP